MTRCATGSITPSRIWASSRSRTSRDLCGSLRCAPSRHAGTHPGGCRRYLANSRRTAPVDRGAAICQSKQRPGAAILRRRHHRRSDDRSVADRGHARDLAQHCVHLPEQAGRYQADRPRTGRALCAGRERPSVGNRVRVNAQLIDAETDAHLWAERFDGDTSDLFVLQDEITSQIAFALNIELIVAEAARPTEHSDAMDYIFRGRAVQASYLRARIMRRRISLLERALALDPQSIEVQSCLARVLVNGVVTFMTDTAAADIARAEGLIEQALATSPRSFYAHYVKGPVLRAQGRCEEAILEYETSLALNRNSVGALQGLGWCKLYTGSMEEAIPIAEQAIRLGPRDPTIGFSIRNDRNGASAAIAHR